MSVADESFDDRRSSSTTQLAANAAAIPVADSPTFDTLSPFYTLSKRQQSLFRFALHQKDLQ